MRKLMLAFLCMIPLTMWSLSLELTQGVSSAIPIGIESFSGEQSAGLISSIIKQDLKNAGLFKLIAEKHAKNQAMSLQSWRRLGADTVLTGEVKKEEKGDLLVRFELINAVTKGKMLLAEQYTIKPGQERAFAHFISDRVYQKLVGEKSIFTTKIAYVLVNHKQNKSQYKLEVADFDGNNAQILLESSEPVMSPAWSPDGKKIAYVSFEQRKSQIYIIELATGKRQLVTDFPGINGAPTFSPDGRHLAVVLSKNGAPKLYQVALDSGRLVQLTHGVSIDTEPAYAPDGKSIIFTSNRGGGPQIYQINLSTKKISRLTFSGPYNARASYTPDGKSIIMLSRNKQSYNIAMQDVATSSNHVLTHANRDESPTIAPNGRLVLYATQDQGRGVLAMVSTDGRIRSILPSGEGDVQEPAWSPLTS